MKVDIDIWWESSSQVWHWLVERSDGENYDTWGTVVAEGTAWWRWTAKRKAVSALVAAKHRIEENERNEDRSLSYEVEI